MRSITPVSEFDVVVVGAGFGGISMTHRLRENGFSVQCLEKGPSIGGIWYWNCYPGARVDSHYPMYQLTDRELWEDWTWTEWCPGWEEIRKYFEYVDRKWDMKRSVSLNSNVVLAEFDESDSKWTITCEDGLVTRCQFFISAIGFAAKSYTPPFKNIESFRGPCFHTAHWPQKGIDLKNKRVAVIGTGASGVQVIQEIAPMVKQLTVFQRTPNTPLPMRQRKLTKEFQDQQKADGTYEATLYKISHDTAGGLDNKAVPRNFADDTPEQQQQVFENAWEVGGFRPLGGVYKDILTSRACSDASWRFWASKQGARITDPRKRAIICPPEPLYAFSAKRTPLEQHYFESYNYSHVDVIALDDSPILEFTEKGIRTENEGEMEFDVIVLATGFDALTGGMTQIDIKGTDGLTFRSRWQTEGIHTHLGLACPKYPNMFFFYGPQGPTAFANGPTCVEAQGEWVFRLLQDMKKQGKVRVEATKEAGEKWRKWTRELWE
ncbi:Baeyer-Villiger monooxygenase, partial [Lachnellula suecica]